ncbi:MAG: response regulator [Rhodospirillaceae bacterium]|nr:response regulator [Rhodospirillaceae bacterium]
MQQQARQTALVIEDDALMRDLVGEILRRAGYQVLEAIDGLDGMAQLTALTPELVVTDVFMPDCDGIEVLRETKRRNPVTRVVVISGGSPLIPRMDFLEVASKLGADAVLAKPFTPAELLSAVTASNWDKGGNIRPFNPATAHVA